MSQGIHGSPLVPTMEKCVIFCLVFCLGNISMAASRCLGMFDILDSADTCRSKTERYKELSTTGGLTQEIKEDMCREYGDAEQCLSRLVEGCRVSKPSYFGQVESQLVDLQEGFGQMCTDPAYFNEYMTHAECYSGVSDETGECLRKFDNVIHGEDFDIYTDMCKTVETMESCVTSAVEPVCGKAASRVYLDVCHHRFPKELIAHCQKSTTAEPSTSSLGTNNADKSTPRYLSVLFLAVSTVLLGTFAHEGE